MVGTVVISDAQNEWKEPILSNGAEIIDHSNSKEWLRENSQSFSAYILIHTKIFECCSVPGIVMGEEMIYSSHWH